MNALFCLRLVVSMALLIAGPVFAPLSAPHGVYAPHGLNAPLPAVWTVTSLADSGPGTLRFAIAAANAAPGADAITFAAGGVIELLSPLPEITAPLTITAAGDVTLRGWPLAEAPLLTVAAGVDVVLQGLTFSQASWGAVVNRGSLTVRGCAFNDNYGAWGVAIDNAARLVVEDTTFTGNDAEAWGAIYSTGPLRLSRVRFERNVAAEGAAIYNTAALHLDRVDFLANIAWQGGALYNTGDLAGERVLFTGNESEETGGSLLNYGDARLGRVVFDNNFGRNGGGAFDNHASLALRDVLIQGNSGKWGGAALNSGDLSVVQGAFINNGALYEGGGLANSGAATLTNVTFSGNSAGDVQGGAISNVGTLDLRWVTFMNNRAPEGGALFGGTVTAAGVILAASPQGGNCAGVQLTAGPGNLSDDATCPGFEQLDPRLGPLTGQGAAQVHLPAVDSPAIDRLPVGACAVDADQRLTPRPQGLACDSGAVEITQRLRRIDIVPTSTKNVIPSQGVVNVAVLAEPGFNAPQVAAAEALTFGRTGLEAALVRLTNGAPACKALDVNGDGRSDLVCSFARPATGFQCGDTTGYLRGRTLAGAWFYAQAAVVISGCR